MFYSLLNKAETWLSSEDYRTLARICFINHYDSSYLSWIVSTFSYNSQKNQTSDEKKQTLELVSQRGFSAEENRQQANSYGIISSTSNEESRDVVQTIFDLVKDNEHEHF